MVGLDDTYYFETVEVLHSYRTPEGDCCDVIVGGGYDPTPAKNFAFIRVPDNIEDFAEGESRCPDHGFLHILHL